MTNFPKALDHGPLTQIDDQVYCVSGAFRMGPGVIIARTMTIVNSGEGLVILNAIRLTDAGQAELDAIGDVKHLVKLSDSHGIDEPYYVDRFNPTLWSLPGADLGGLNPDRTLGPDGPIEGGVVIDYCQTGQTAGWRESAYLIPLGNGTLVTCDAIQNCGDMEGASLLGRLVTVAMGFKGGVIVPPMCCVDCLSPSALIGH
jgi:hypothetical protein